MRILPLILMAVMTISSVSFAEQVPQEKEVQIGLSGVYVPGGFDSASDVYVVVNGIFQSGCYRWKRAEVTHPQEFVHEIKSIAAVTPGMCIMVLMPFQKEVRLGRLNSGNHVLHFDNGDGTYIEKNIVIE